MCFTMLRLNSETESSFFVLDTLPSIYNIRVDKSDHSRLKNAFEMIGMTWLVQNVL